MEETASPTAKLCAWACATQYEEVPADARSEAVRVLYDQIGGMIASATLPTCQPVVDLVRKLGPGGACSIVGHPVRTSVTNAALANGTIGHGTELDSTGQQSTGHLAATAVPTALSVGQYVGASGKEFMRALVLGAEATARFQSTLRHGTRGAFATSVGATLGVAINAGLLLKLDAERMENALGLAASGACGLNSQHADKTHQLKSLNFGKSVEAGVLAALLAKEGYHGPKEVLTIKHGFFDAFLDRPEAGHQVVEGLGENYLMRQVAYKRYPVGGPDQTPLYAFLQLMKTHGFTADEVEQIEVLVSQAAYNTVTRNQHESVNLETLLSLAAVYREISFPCIHDARYAADPRIEAFRKRVPIVITPRSGAATTGERLNMSIAARLRNGQILRQEMRYPLMTQEEIESKFRSLAGLRLTHEQVAGLERSILGIESAPSMVPLGRSLEIPYRP